MKAKYRSCCCHCGHSAYHPQLGYTTQNQLMPPKKLAVRDSIFSSSSHVPSSQVAALPCHLQLGNCAPRPQSADPRKIISHSAVISTEGALRRSMTYDNHPVPSYPSIHLHIALKTTSISLSELRYSKMY